MTQLEMTTSKVASRNGSLHEFHDRDACVGGMATSEANHFGCHVDADDTPPVADLDGRGEAVEAGTATQVQHPLAGRETGRPTLFICFT
jgi:hypothetical protein